jgi:hypothetical protein
MATFKKFNKDKRPKRNTQSLLFKRKRFCRCAEKSSMSKRRGLIGLSETQKFRG